jgi:hypothetical protein
VRRARVPLTALLVPSVPAFDAAAIRSALDALLDMLECHLPALTGGQMALTADQGASCGDTGATYEH